MSDHRPDTALVAVLERAQQRGWVGKGPVSAQIAHARAFLDPIDTPPGQAADLGSGGGLPALVLALELPATTWSLMESSRARCDHLVRSAAELELGARVEVVHARVEELATDPAWRERFDLVTARSFGPPAVTAECASPLLHEAGLLVVSDPPDPAEDRWPSPGLATLALRERAAVVADGVHLRVLEKTGPTPPGVPRPNAAIRARPRW